MTAIERLEELAAKASERPWQGSSRPDGIVTLGRCANPASGADDSVYYGGKLIFESCGPSDREFIVALVAALPDLLAVVRAALNQPGPGPIRDHEMWSHHEDCPRLGCSCGLAAFRAALEPLLGEARP